MTSLTCDPSRAARSRTRHGELMFSKHAQTSFAGWMRAAKPSSRSIASFNRRTEMDDKEQKREARLQRMCERLGDDKPGCINCGLEDIRCLEAHHIAGSKFGDALVIVCRNCHRILSDDQKDHPPPAGDDATLD